TVLGAGWRKLAVLRGDAGRGELAAKPEEEGLERERGGELELLGLAPGGADDLAGPLGRLQALERRVGAQVVEAVHVDRRRLRAARDDDEVAVPPLELLERREELVPLRAPLGAADPLLRLAARQLEHGDGLLRLLPRLRPALAETGEHDLGRVRGVEGGVEVDGARDAEKRLAPAGRGGVEEPLRPV